MFQFQIVRRESLTPPEENQVTWDEYINAEPGEYPTLGRQLVYKESSKTFRATVAMVSSNKPQIIWSIFSNSQFHLIRYIISEQRVSTDRGNVAECVGSYSAI